MATLTINGMEKHFADGELPVSISELLRRLDVSEATVVAEVDGQVVEQERFGQVMVRPGQNIELVRFVPGG